MKIKRLEEFKISRSTHKKINALLTSTYGIYPEGKSYVNQVPDFRFLVWSKKQLIGHMGVEHRMIKVNDQHFKIFGVVDLCVEQTFRKKNIASQLLMKLEELGQENKIDFILLVAQQHELYKKNGFQLLNNQICRWLIIHNDQSLGVGNRRMKDCLMIKALRKKEWNEGPIDFMGHIF